MAYFRCYQQAVRRTFVIDVIDPERIKEARAILEDRETSKIHVRGTVIKEFRTYNWPWSWHLDPRSIDFFEYAAEVCDASVVLLEKRLRDVGGGFLPHNVWCPWNSRVIEEVELES
jgi:hypothetical protein